MSRILARDGNVVLVDFRPSISAQAAMGSALLAEQAYTAPTGIIGVDPAAPGADLSVRTYPDWLTNWDWVGKNPVTVREPEK